MNTSDLIFHQLLKRQFPNDISDSYPWPEAFCLYPADVKAIVLGCDPSNKHTENMPYVFGFHSTIYKARDFFQVIEDNLRQIGLDHTQVYIQNLCRNYFKKESSKNKIWKDAAELWIPRLKEEIRFFPENVPVLLTAELLYRVLLNSEKKKHAKELYTDMGLTPISPENNKLGRILFPFYRHHEYKLSSPDWLEYKEKLLKYFE